MVFRGSLLTLVVACALAAPSVALGATPASVTTTASATEPSGNVEFTINCGTMDFLLTEVAATGAISYTTEDGTATKGQDYTEKSGTVTCAPGETPTSQKVQVPIVDDTTDELTETVKLKIAGTAPTFLGSIGTATASANIADDDIPTVSITPLAYVAEGTAKATINVTMSQAPAQAVTVPFSTADSTAVAGSDYTFTDGSVTIPAGQPGATIEVPIADDGAVEQAESFFVNLGTPTNATALDDNKRGTVVVFDNDEAPLPTFSLGDNVRLTEGDSGTVNALFTVTLSQAAKEQTRVAWKTADWTATAGDYESAQGTLIFEPGQTSKTISVIVRGDTAVEPTEVFGVVLEGPAGATINEQKKAALAIIVNDDEPPAAAGPQVTIGSPFVVRNRKAFTSLITCPTDAKACNGRLAATSGKMKVGRATFGLAGGQFADVRVRFSRKAVRTLARRALRVKLTAVVTDGAGSSTRTITRSFRIKRVKRFARR